MGDFQKLSLPSNQNKKGSIWPWEGIINPPSLTLLSFSLFPPLSLAYQISHLNAGEGVGRETDTWENIQRQTHEKALWANFNASKVQEDLSILHLNLHHSIPPLRKSFCDEFHPAKGTFYSRNEQSKNAWCIPSETDISFRWCIPIGQNKIPWLFPDFSLTHHEIPGLELVILIGISNK